MRIRIKYTNNGFSSSNQTKRKQILKYVLLFLKHFQAINYTFTNIDNTPINLYNIQNTD